MIVGFTGTRVGLTDAQKGALASFLRSWHVLALVHGDCVGADEQCDVIAVEIGISRVLRPCTIDAMRAHCERHGGHVLKIYKPEPPLMRNERIVYDSHIVLAGVHGPETTRSGTWSTVRHARRQRKHVITIFPSGQIKHEGI